MQKNLLLQDGWELVIFARRGWRIVLREHMIQLEKKADSLDFRALFGYFEDQLRVPNRTTSIND